jgi:ClpP class serine protease
MLTFKDINTREIFGQKYIREESINLKKGKVQAEQRQKGEESKKGKGKSVGSKKYSIAVVNVRGAITRLSKGTQESENIESTGSCTCIYIENS